MIESSSLLGGSTKSGMDSWVSLLSTNSGMDSWASLPELDIAEATAAGASEASLPLARRSEQ